MPADGVDKDEEDETHPRAPTEEEHTNSTSPAILHTARRSKRGMRRPSKGWDAMRTGIRVQLSTALSAYKVRTGKEKERRAHVTEKPL